MADTESDSSDDNIPLAQLYRQGFQESDNESDIDLQPEPNNEDLDLDLEADEARSASRSRPTVRQGLDTWTDECNQDDLDLDLNQHYLCRGGAFLPRPHPDTEPKSLFDIFPYLFQYPTIKRLSLIHI